MVLHRSTFVRLVPVLAATAAGCMGAQDTIGLSALAADDGPVAPALFEGSPEFEETWDGYDGLAWDQGEVTGSWGLVFHGYGPVEVPEIDLDPGLVLQPMTATDEYETHAALVVTDGLFRSVDVEATIITRAQLRENDAPNPWEVGWLIWDYIDNDHFYYAIAKPNGWELGKRDPAYPGGQRFLATGEDVLTPIGQPVVLRARRSANVIELAIDDVPVVTFVDDENPYKGGAVGLYAEDSQVLFDDIRVWTP